MRLLLPISILFLATAIFWYAQTAKYEIAILEPSQITEEGSNFIKFNTRSGKAFEYCNINSGYCQKWEKYRESTDEHNKSVPSLVETMEQKRTEKLSK